MAITSRELTGKHYAFLGLCALLLFPTLLEIFGYSLLPWDRIESALAGTGGWFSDPNRFRVRFGHRKGLFGPGRRDPALVALYNSTRDPPEGFEKWIAYARDNKCHLGPYSRIERDLEAFRGGRDPSKLQITRQQISQTAELPKTIQFTVRNGTMHAGGSYWWMEAMMKMAEGFQKDLPDMDFVVNGMDEPRVLPGKVDNIDARYDSQQCQNASETFREFRHLHASFSNRPEGMDYFPTKDLLPLFSQSKINECHADITFPTHYNLDKLLSEEEQEQLRPWEDRKDILFFRGSSTGGHYSEQRNYTIAHRQRLVEMAKGNPHMDIGFTSILQCNNVCKEMKERYGTLERVDEMVNFEHKYLMSVDGNTFVSRLTRFMSSGSLIFRAGMYSEWYDEWIRPSVHYLQVKLDYSDLETQLQWALQHDEEARLIGENAQRFARTRLRNVDLSCYFYRLLLEYSAIVE